MQNLVSIWVISNLAKKNDSSCKKSGADFVKTQIFSVDRLSPGPWDTDGRRQIYLKAQMSEDKLRKLKAYSKKLK